jgi:hypothetical protein
VLPRRRRAGLDRLEHEQLGAVQLPHDRHPGRDARRGLVQRREVVQVQDVGVRRAGAVQRSGPRFHVRGVLVVADPREAAIRRAGTVLVRRMHGRVAGAEVDRPDVQPRIEGGGVAEPVARGAGDERHLPAVGGKLVRERSRDVRGSTSGREHQAVEDAHVLQRSLSVTWM